jgi:hypothetical protein
VSHYWLDRSESLCYSPSVRKQGIRIQLNPATLDRLRQMSDRYGYTVAALIRHCVDARLDLLDQQLARKAAQTPEPENRS